MLKPGSYSTPVGDLLVTCSMGQTTIRFLGVTPSPFWVFDEDGKYVSFGVYLDRPPSKQGLIPKEVENKLKSGED